MRSDVKAVTEFLAQDHAPSRLTRQIRDESDKYAYPIEWLVEEAYNFETGTWIVLRAMPDPRELKKLLMNVSPTMGLSHTEALHLSSATYMLLVTEPQTLQFHDSDLRRYAYWATQGPKFDHPVFAYERTHAISSDGGGLSVRATEAP